MNEIYWITVLGKLSDFLVLTSVVLAVVTFFIYVGSTCEFYEDDKKPYYKWMKRTGIGTIITSVLAIFTPSTQDLYAIYDIGGIIDYVQSNDTAKQLPDKTIKALDKYLDELNEEEQQ